MCGGWKKKQTVWCQRGRNSNPYKSDHLKSRLRYFPVTESFFILVKKKKKKKTKNPPFDCELTVENPLCAVVCCVVIRLVELKKEKDQNETSKSSRWRLRGTETARKQPVKSNSIKQNVGIKGNIEFSTTVGRCYLQFKFSKISSHASSPSFLRPMQSNLVAMSMPHTQCGIAEHESVNVLTVADGAQRIVVLHALADDPPLGEDGVWADGAHVKGAPRSHQVIGADVTLAAPDGKVPVGQCKCGFT